MNLTLPLFASFISKRALRSKTPPEPVSGDGATEVYQSKEDRPGMPLSPSKSYLKGVVYNPSSLDSVYAAAQLLCTSALAGAVAIEYDYLDAPDALAGYQHLFVCGTELCRQAIELVLNNPSAKLTVFAHRGSYAWVTPGMKKLWGTRVEFVWPEEDFTNALLAKTDNTAIWMTFAWIDRHGFKVSAALLDEARRSAMYVTALALGDVPELHSGETPEPRQRELEHKAVVYNLGAVLRSAVRSPGARERLERAKLDTSTHAYIDHWRGLCRTYKRAMTARPYGQGTSAKMVPTLALAQTAHHDLFVYGAVQDKSCVTYEDRQGVRVWRTHAPDASVRSIVTCALKGRVQWMEGSFVCTYTQIPQALS